MVYCDRQMHQAGRDVSFNLHGTDDDIDIDAIHRDSATGCHRLIAIYVIATMQGHNIASNPHKASGRTIETRLIPHHFASLSAPQAEFFSLDFPANPLLNDTSGAGPNHLRSQTYGQRDVSTTCLPIAIGACRQPPTARSPSAIPPARVVTVLDSKCV